MSAWECRVAVILVGVFDIGFGLFLEYTAEWARSSRPSDYWLVYGGPPISDSEERVEHVLFKATIVLVFGIVTLLLGVLLPDSIFQTFGLALVFFLGVAAMILGLIGYADALERGRDTSSDGLSEEEKERIRKID